MKRRLDYELYNATYMIVKHSAVEIRFKHGKNNDEIQHLQKVETRNCCR